MTTIVPVSMTSSRGPDERSAEVRTVRIGERSVRCAAVDVGLDPGRRTVDELVGYDEGAGLGLRLEPSHGTGSQHLFDAEGAQGPEVGPVVDPVRRELVTRPVAREERDRPTRDVTDRDRRRRVAVRRAHLDARRALEELVEAAAADDGDARMIVGHARQSANPVEPDVTAGLSSAAACRGAGRR
jgi:hypothetical protein